MVSLSTSSDALAHHSPFRPATISLVFTLIALLSSCIHPSRSKLSQPASSIDFIDHLPPYIVRILQSLSLSGFHSKCLPKLPRKSPPRAARPQLERHRQRRKKLARRLQHRLATRRRTERRGRKLTPPTSTKVTYAFHSYILPSINTKPYPISKSVERFRHALHS